MIFFLAAGQRAVYLLPICPAIALLAGRVLSQWLDSGHSVPVVSRSRWRFFAGVIPELPRNPLVLASTLALVGLSLAIATPVTRWLQMGESSQTAFVERTTTLISDRVSLKAAPLFPQSTLGVLACRLKRLIPRTPPACQGTGFYLAKRSDLPLCLMGQREFASTGQSNRSLVLIGTMDSRKRSSRLNFVAPISRSLVFNQAREA